MTTRKGQHGSPLKEGKDERKVKCEGNLGHTHAMTENKNKKAHKERMEEERAERGVKRKCLGPGNGTIKNEEGFRVCRGQKVGMSVAW